LPSAGYNIAEFDHIGRGWVLYEPDGQIHGLRQTDPNRSAYAFIGGHVRNQETDVSFGINQVSSETAAWVGMFGRYVDARTHYLAILRVTNRVEIRKTVNGVVTVLAAANYPVARDRFQEARFRLVEDQLQLFVGTTLVLSARDDEIPAGKYGVATNRAAATWDHIFVTQP
jgi:hypothetical protein